MSENAPAYGYPSAGQDMPKAATVTNRAGRVLEQAEQVTMRLNGLHNRLWPVAQENPTAKMPGTISQPDALPWTLEKIEQVLGSALKVLEEIDRKL